MSYSKSDLLLFVRRDHFWKQTCTWSLICCKPSWSLTSWCFSVFCRGLKWFDNLQVDWLSSLSRLRPFFHLYCFGILKSKLRRGSARNLANLQMCVIATLRVNSARMPHFFSRFVIVFSIRLVLLLNHKRVFSWKMHFTVQTRQIYINFDLLFFFQGKCTFFAITARGKIAGTSYVSLLVSYLFENGLPDFLRFIGFIRAFAILLWWATFIGTVLNGNIYGLKDFGASFFSMHIVREVFKLRFIIFVDFCEGKFVFQVHDFALKWL